MTDQGTEFHNRVNDELMKVFGIQHCLTTLYHPQANGMDERLNQALVNSLAKFAQDSCQTWDEKLPEIVNVYNTAMQESTKHLRRRVACQLISMPSAAMMLT